MKLKIEDIKYDLAPFGAGYGQPCLSIYFGEEDSDYKVEKEINPIGTYNENQPGGYVSVEEIEKDIEMLHLTKEDYLKGEALFKEIEKVVKDKKLELKFEKFLMGERAKNTHFVGEIIVSPEHRHTFSGMMMALSYKSRVTQVESFNHDKSTIMKQLGAPRMAFVGLPKYFSGAEQFYENFNAIHAVITSEVDFENVNPLSLTEFSNHQFSTVHYVLTDNYKEEWAKYKEKFIDELDFCHPAKRYIVDASTKSHKEIAELVKSEDVRVQIKSVTSMEF